MQNKLQENRESHCSGIIVNLKLISITGIITYATSGSPYLMANIYFPRIIPLFYKLYFSIPIIKLNSWRWDQNFNDFNFRIT
jgi:hypothetical protein